MTIDAAKNPVEKTSEKTVGDKETAEELAKAKSSVAALGETVNAIADTRVGLQSINVGDISELVGWKTGKGRYERVTKEDVVHIVNALQEPYNSEISDFIKKGNIKGMQEYLNNKINGGEIDKDELGNFLRGKKIRFDGHIDVDGKFGPQTLYTMKYIIKKQAEGPTPEKPTPENPTEPESKEVLPDLSWIQEEMSNALNDVMNNGKENYSAERNFGEGKNFKVDPENHLITISTRGTKVNGSVENHTQNNRCEIDWKTGKAYIICKNNKYEMPIQITPFVMDDKGFPDGDKRENRERVQAFTRVGNLYNMLKANFVFNGSDDAFEESGGDIEYNDKWSNATEAVSGKVFKELTRKYSSVGVNFDKGTRIQMASVLDAMKFDIGRLPWKNIDNSGAFHDGLDKEHQKRIKHYSKNFSST